MPLYLEYVEYDCIYAEFGHAMTYLWLGVMVDTFWFAAMKLSLLYIWVCELYDEFINLLSVTYELDLYSLILLPLFFKCTNQMQLHAQQLFCSL